MISTSIVGIDKTEHGYNLVRKDNDIFLTNAAAYIEPVWTSVESDGKKMTELRSGKNLIVFVATTIENHPERGVLVHFSGIYEGGDYTEGVVPVEKTEELFLNLLMDLEKVV